MLEAFTNYIQAISPFHLYLFLFSIAYFENVFPPIPGDLPVAFVGSVLGQINISMLLCIIWTSVGSLLGFMTMFLLGRYAGHIFVNKARSDTKLGQFMLKAFSKENMLTVNKNFRRYGYSLILLNRFLPGSRSVISIVSGMSQFDFLYSHIAALVSAIVWNSMLIIGGFILGAAWETLSLEVSLYGFAATFVIAGIGVMFYLNYYKKKKKSETDDV